MSRCQQMSLASAACGDVSEAPTNSVAATPVCSVLREIVAKNLWPITHRLFLLLPSRLQTTYEGDHPRPSTTCEVMMSLASASDRRYSGGNTKDDTDFRFNDDMRYQLYTICTSSVFYIKNRTFAATDQTKSSTIIFFNICFFSHISHILYILISDSRHSWWTKAVYTKPRKTTAVSFSPY